tara:strand:+ start:320 stop:541 length:222 start_codon:yes stop_codon:yes gene_type:complete
MKYLVTITLIALSINAFTYGDNAYVVCEDDELNKVTMCVNAQIKKGYKPQSGLHAISDPSTNNMYWFQALVKY